MVPMDNDQALASLERRPALTPGDRLRAARFLARNATHSHRLRLSKIREAENNAWVRHALNQALRRLERGTAAVTPNTDEQTPEALVQNTHLEEELRAQAIQETTALFLHELRPMVGLLHDTAASEMENYTHSATKASVGRIQSFLEAIEQLREASVSASFQEFDLTDLIVRAVEEESTLSRVTFDVPLELQTADSALSETESAQQRRAIGLMLARRDPVVTTGDPVLVGLALANALRNAVEASLVLPQNEQGDVVLNWGITDTDSWIAVLDEGCGLPAGWDRLTKPGITTKPKTQGHLGMGLPIAQQAMESMRGSFKLAPRSGRGVSCEIRWPRRGLAK